MTDFNALLSTPAGDVKRPPNVPPGTWRLQVLKYEFVKLGQNQTDAIRYTLKTLAPHDGVDEQELSEFLEFYDGEAGKKTTNVTFFLTPDALYRLTGFLTNVLGLDGSKSTKELLADSVNMECLGTFKQQMRQDGSGFFTAVDSNDLAPVPA